MDEEEIKNIDPEKKLVEILGQIEGLNKDIKNKIKKFKLIQSRGEDIEKFIANAKEYEKILAEDDLFTNLEENLENAESVDDVNKKLYNKIRNTLNNLRVSIKKVEKVKENSKETVRSIGKIAIDAEDYMKELEEIKNYVKSDRLKGMAKEFLQKAEKTKDRADDVTDKLYPQAEELAKKVDEKSDFLEEYNGKYLEYRNKFQPLNNMYADMQNENEE
jgi:septation ring formation regulator EzrA